MAFARSALVGALVLILSGPGGPTHAQGLGCDITLRLRNVGSQPVDAHIRTFEARSRIGVVPFAALGGVAPASAWGPWRRVQNGGWQPAAVDLRIQPGARSGGTYQSAALCEDRREYRIEYTCRGGGRANLRFETRTDDTRAQTVVVEIGSRCD